MLFTAAACALGVATTATASVLSQPEPERCCAAVPTADKVSAAPRTTTTRPAGPPLCLIGSWRAVDETFMVKFYTDRPEIRFTSKGREFEFRPDGTMLERQADVVMTASYGDVELRIVGKGTSEFTWKADDRAITYLARTKVDHSWSFYDHRGWLSTKAAYLEPNLNEVDDYVCSGDTMLETNADGFRSSWVRTDSYGVYG